MDERDHRTWRRLYDRLRPVDEAELQRTLEDTLFTWCDGMRPGEMGMHWSFDWLFAPREAFAVAVGRFFEPTTAYAYVALRHQSNDLDTRGTGVVHELRLPLEVFRYDRAERRCTMRYEGPANVRILGLPRTDGEEAPASGESYPHAHVVVDIEKRLWSDGSGAVAARPWSSTGTVEVFDAEGGESRGRWSWSYAIEKIVDRPDYDAELMLAILRSGLIPSGNGHFIPAMRAELTADSDMRYIDGAGDEIHEPMVGIYLDGNFGRSMKRDEIVTDRWAWMCAPQLWTVDGIPTDHMMTFGFFQKSLLPVIGDPDRWTGAILWRSDEKDMVRFTPLNLLDQITVSFHSRRYLDVTFVTADRGHRITVRAWSHTLTTPMTTPSGREFRDHQDLMADAYVVIEENEVGPLSRLARRPRWTQVARLVTNMFGFEFGEQDRVIGTPGYPAFGAVPEMPAWFRHALNRIPDDELGEPLPAPRLAVLNH